MSIPLANPIPGQSLTTEPKSVPWEQPPHKPNPLDALEYHLDQINSDEVIDNIIDMLDVLVPVEVIASTQLSKGVMDGIHTVDTKGLLMPIIASVIEGIAVSAGVDYILTYEDLGDLDEGETEASMRLKIMERLQRELAKNGGVPDEGVELMEATMETMQAEDEAPQEEEIMDAEIVEEEPEQEEPQMTGLMAKGA